MQAEAPAPGRCGLDTVEIARMEKFLTTTPASQLADLFSAAELADAGGGPRRVESLAARFAAKEACCKLFPRETALETIRPQDFSVRRDPYGAPEIEASPTARAAMDRHRIADIRVSLTHTKASASAVAMAVPMRTGVPWFGRWFYHLFPYRRALVLENLRRVFGETLPEEEIVLLAKAYYAHYARFLAELVRLPMMSAAKRRRMIRIENMEVPIRMHKQGRGLILLTGHFGNWEVSTVAGIQQFSQYQGLFHFVRRPLKPAWLNRFVTRRFHKVGLGTIAKRGSLDQILDLLAGGAIIVYVFDQHAGRRDGVVVDFFGHPASTFKSPALIAMSSGAPVIPVSNWREPDGTHVMRFEEPVPLVDCENVGEAIRRNTRAFNARIEQMLLRHPEQWIWMHRRWKVKE
jgi:phosphopantetheine--protein transferase-like protein